MEQICLSVSFLSNAIVLSSLFIQLPNLTKLDITYGVKKIGMKYDRMLFGMKVIYTSQCNLPGFGDAQISDANCLAKSILDSENMTTLILQSNLVDDDLLRMLMTGLIKVPETTPRCMTPCSCRIHKSHTWTCHTTRSRTMASASCRNFLDPEVCWQISTLLIITFTLRWNHNLLVAANLKSYRPRREVDILVELFEEMILWSASIFVLTDWWMMGAESYSKGCITIARSLIWICLQIRWVVNLQTRWPVFWLTSIPTSIH